MFVFFAVFLSAAAIAVTVLPRVFRGRTFLRAVFFVNLLLVAAGILCLVHSAWLSHNVLADAAADTAFCAWAKDMFSVWMRTGGIFAAVVGGITFVAALIRHSLGWVRSGVMAATSVLFWILGGMYAVMCVTETADLVTPVYLWTAGCALLMLTGAAVDSAFFLHDTKK